MALPRRSLAYALRATRADAATYRHWWREPGFVVTLSYRLRRWRKRAPWLLRLLALPIDALCGALRRCVSDSHLCWQVEIGPGLYLPHANGLIVNHRARIGSRVALFQQVTLGEWREGAPRIRRGASLFAGAKAFGDIVIGRNAMIGANAVVNRDVPADTVVSAAACEHRAKKGEPRRTPIVVMQD